MLSFAFMADCISRYLYFFHIDVHPNLPTPINKDIINPPNIVVDYSDTVQSLFSLVKSEAVVLYQPLLPWNGSL